MLKRSLASALVALGAAIVLPGIAEAYPSWTSGSVNQRVGPGTGYPRVGTLPPGAQVDVRYCTYGWCQVASYLGLGFVSAGYLGGGVRVLPAPPPPLFVQPYPYPYRFYRPGPVFRFSIGPRRWW